MPKLLVSESIVIDKPLTKIHEIISDFHHWRPWSPWLVSEPETKVDVRPDGKYYKWDGHRVGSGEMTILNESENHIDYDLTFLKPWKSTAKVQFDLKSQGSSTEVTWSMQSSLPWFMFWMTKMMNNMIASDYQRGLSMLKEHVEEGVIHSKLEFIGEKPYKGSQYIGVRTTISIDKMPKQMESEFTQMMTYVADKQDIVNGQAITIYHKWDFAKQIVSYTSGIPVKSIPSDLPSNMITFKQPDQKVYTLRHIGKYVHLGNAWSTVYSMHRNKEFKTVRGQHPFETYIVGPKEAPAHQMVSDINYPMK